MANSHPQNAAYVSADGLVSFDRFGRKLDSGGRVVAGDRQRAGDAGASPIQRREPEQPKGPPQPAAAGYTFPANATGLPVVRSRWDNSIVQPAQGAASVAGVVGAGRGNNPNVLAPGGIDPKTGKPYPTAMNGGVRAPGSGQAWRQPWMNQQRPTVNSGAPATSVAPPQPRGIPFQVDGLNTGQAWRRTTPNQDMPYPPTGASMGQRVFEPYQNAYLPVTDPLAVYRQGVTPDQGPSFSLPNPAVNGMVVDPYSQQTIPVTDPLAPYRFGVQR